MTLSPNKSHHKDIFTLQTFHPKLFLTILPFHLDSFAHNTLDLKIVCFGSTQDIFFFWFFLLLFSVGQQSKAHIKRELFIQWELLALFFQRVRQKECFINSALGREIRRRQREARKYHFPQIETACSIALEMHAAIRR